MAWWLAQCPSDLGAHAGRGILASGSAAPREKAREIKGDVCAGKPRSLWTRDSGDVHAEGAVGESAHPWHLPCGGLQGEGVGPADSQQSLARSGKQTRGPCSRVHWLPATYHPHVTQSSGLYLFSR